jgi:hypothetical protein
LSFGVIAVDIATCVILRWSAVATMDPMSDDQANPSTDTGAIGIPEWASLAASPEIDTARFATWSGTGGRSRCKAWLLGFGRGVV